MSISVISSQYGDVVSVTDRGLWLQSSGALYSVTCLAPSYRGWLYSWLCSCWA